MNLTPTQSLQIMYARRRMSRECANKIHVDIGHYYQARSIIYQQGATREKSILQNPHIVTYGDTWNNDHKIIDIVDAFDKNNSCSVDLITNTICG